MHDNVGAVSPEVIEKRIREAAERQGQRASYVSPRRGRQGGWIFHDLETGEALSDQRFPFSDLSAAGWLHISLYEQTGTGGHPDG